MNPVLGVQPQCPYCETPLVWSVELLECLVKEQSEDNEFDQAILEAIQNQNGQHRMLPMQDVPFFFWLADDPPSIFMPGWCPKCKRMSAPVFPLSKLFRLVYQARRGDEEKY